MGRARKDELIYFALRILHLLGDPLSFTKYLGTQVSEILLKVVPLLTAPILRRKALKKASVLSFDTENPHS